MSRTHLRARRAPDGFIRHGVVGNISACHADARGSIPRDGAFLKLFYFFVCLEFNAAAALITAPRAAHRRGIGAIGSVRASQARGTGIETQILHDVTGVLAQSEACVLSKDEVLGSKPRYSSHLLSSVWSSWL